MSSLPQALADYLRIRRALGFKLERAERLLAQFVAYLRDHNIEVPTIEDALAWATSPAAATPRWWAHRLSTARAFAVTCTPSTRASRSHHQDCSGQATPANPLPILPGRYHRARRCRRHPAPPAWGSDLPDPDRPAGRRRDARRRGDPARPRRPRRRPRRAAAGARQQVRQVPPAPAAPNHGGGAAGLSQGARQAAPGACQPRAAAVHRGHPAWLQQRLAHLPPPGPPGRHHRPLGVLPAQDPRPPPQLRGPHHAGLVRQWRRRAGPAARLSTYLGHADPKHTYWYLQAAPELLALAAHRLDAHQAGQAGQP